MKGISRLTVGLCLALTLAGQTQPVFAAIISTDEALTPPAAHTALIRDQLRAALARSETQLWLQSQGVAPESIEARVNQLTDHEAQQLASRLDALPAGGDILGTLLFVFVVFVITDALGATDIFPFVHPIKR